MALAVDSVTARRRSARSDEIVGRVRRQLRPNGAALDGRSGDARSEQKCPGTLSGPSQGFLSCQVTGSGVKAVSDCVTALRQCDPKCGKL